MMPTQISASISRPRWPLVRWVQGMSTITGMMITAISEKPNQSSLRIFTCPAPVLTTNWSSFWMSSSLTWTISFSLSTSTSCTSASREGHSPCLMQMMQRMISTMPCTSMNAPASGMIVLNG